MLASSNSQRRNYLQHFLSHTSSSRANFFLTYDDRDRLDDPPARLDNFATPSRILQLYSWNIETFIGVEFFSQFQALLHCGHILFTRNQISTYRYSLNSHIPIFTFPAQQMTHMQGLDSLSTTLWLTLFQRISPITRILCPLLMHPLVYLLLRFSHYGVNTLDTLSATLPLLNSTCVLTTHYLYALFPLRLEEAPPELIGQKSLLLNLHMFSNVTSILLY